MEFDATFWVILVSFFVFMGLMRQVYFEPIRAIHAVRHHEQTEAQQLAGQYAQSAQSLEASYQLSLQAARQQSQQLVSEHRRQALAQAAERLQGARDESAKTLAAHSQQLQQQANALYEELVPERSVWTEQLVQRLTANAKTPSLV